MDGQAILAKSFRDDFHHAFGIALIAKPDHEIIRIADQEGIASQARLHVLFEPEVEHIVQNTFEIKGEITPPWGDPESG